jgi:CRP/FNR family cyclic AMP-dependent transcriptional regulator
MQGKNASSASAQEDGHLVDIEAVRNVPIFADLQTAQLTELSGLLTVRRFAKGALLVVEGEPGDAFHLLLEGSVAVVRIAPDARETILSILKEGDFFGEMSLFDSSPRSASIKALTAVEVGVIEQAAILDLIERNPSIGRALVVSLSRRLREANTLIAATTSSDIRSRLALLLLNLTSNFGEAAENGTRITLRLTNQQMADMIGTTRETVNRTLNKFWDERIIDMRTSNIIVTDKTKLETLLP